jgi:deoxycytidylate deaminase
MKHSENYFIQEAFNEANKSSLMKKFGAVIVYRNKIISRGHNCHTGVFSSNEHLKQYLLRG